MTTLFKDVDDLRTTVKINSNLEFDVLLPFIEDARDIYLVRYIGIELVDKLEAGALDILLLEKVKRALGPLAVMLAIPELGIRVGDSGITVQNNKNGDYSPASDSKISSAIKNYQFRGFQAIERLLAYLENNLNKYPEWVASECYTLRQCNYLNSAKDFQNEGLVDINYSRLSFELMRCTMSMIEERIIKNKLGASLDARLRALLTSSSIKDVDALLISYIRKFIAAKVAEIYTFSKSQNEQLISSEFKPLIRSMSEDVSATGNYFATQADFYLSKIEQHLTMFSTELGLEVKNNALLYNNRDNKLFCDIG